MPGFVSNLLRWPVQRTRRSFHVFVVEPYSYQPDTHAAIFSAAIGDLLTAPVNPVSAGAEIRQEAPVLPDLITFPEAFLPLESLIDAIAASDRIESWPCTHVGLRATAEVGSSHLLSKAQIEELLAQLREFPSVLVDDLEQFSRWLGGRHSSERFNVGCLFMKDFNGRMRICLHPKISKASIERSPTSTNDMTEANLLSVVSLIPEDKSHKTINIQPLLCSDAFLKSPDGPPLHPIGALNLHADCFVDPPDHIDIVSIAACTPQAVVGAAEDDQQTPTLAWHQQFKESFQGAASGVHARHFHAMFVLSNFTNIPPDERGGLSGAFVPVSVSGARFPSFVSVGPYGKVATLSSDNSWLSPYKEEFDKGKLECRGYLASLDPYEQIGPVRTIGFILQKFPRDQSMWESKSNRGLASFELRTPVVVKE